jgi:arylsulfatase A-like enzyme
MKYLIGLICYMSTFVMCYGQQEAPNKTPNILFIVADDLGYADMGCYGSDINTPNLDKLAAGGIRFSRYHSAPLCAIARSMFLTGNDNHIAGMGMQGRVTGITGYEGRLTERVATVPALLQDAGYFTCMAGKWHLGLEPRSNPAAKGFDRSFVMLEGGGNHYKALGALNQRPLSIYTEDGKEAFWPEGAYSTDFYTDKIIEQLKDAKKAGKPFFAYAAYTSPHWPLQVDTSFWHKYDGKYSQGYEVQRQINLENLKTAGMIPTNATLPVLHALVKPWASLSEDRKKWEARAMALYAGMVENLDANIGRLINYLKTSGEYDNTLIVFVSDNGAAAEDFYNSDTSSTFLRDNYTEAYEEMGKPHSYISYGRQWAEAGAAPFLYFKGYTTEGGMVAPMIISGPSVTDKGKICHSFVTLMDIAPTFYQLADIKYPTTYQGKAIHPMRGQSFHKIFSNTQQQVHDDDYVFAIEVAGNAMVRKGDWKIVNLERPFDESNFRLYNVVEDIGEGHDVRDKYPEKYWELVAAWRKYADDVKVRTPPPLAGEGL